MKITINSQTLLIYLLQLVLVICSKPKIDESDPYDTQKPLPSSGLKKSESSHSMDWDSILENARQEALAPDHVPLVSIIE